MFDLHVENMVSDKGNSVPNQFIITLGNHKYFQSYDKIICVIDSFPYEASVITLDNNWDEHSKTTSKYLCKFLNVSKPAIISGIKNGTIKVDYLN